MLGIVTKPTQGHGTADWLGFGRDHRVNTALLEIAPGDLPMIWDADFMLGPPDADGADSYVLGEINVSSVSPIPDEASAEIARRVADRLQGAL